MKNNIELSKTAINKVGESIRRGIGDPNFSQALTELILWRESYGFVMNNYYDKCNRLVKRPGYRNVKIAQRLKRLPTIIDKLDRFPEMSLSRMQDVAGIRIVAEDMDQLRKIDYRIRRWKNLIRIKDYINEPKDDGYRSKHYIFKQREKLVEIQLRTQLQHIWATSIETVDAFNDLEMKTGKIQKYWYEFFRLSSAILTRIECTNILDGFEQKDLYKLCELLKDNMQKNNITQKLQAIDMAKTVYKNKIKIKNEKYLVLDLNIKENVCDVFGYNTFEYQIAVNKYQELEKRTRKYNNVVLISVNKIRDLENFYPNYFLNLKVFNIVLGLILEKFSKNS